MSRIKGSRLLARPNRKGNRLPPKETTCSGARATAYVISLIAIIGNALVFITVMSRSKYLHPRPSIFSSAIIQKQASSQNTSKPKLVPSPCTNKCLWNSGRNGSWVQDWDFAKEHGQYPNPWVIPHGPYATRTHFRFRPSDDAPFSWPSSWKWVDNGKDCQVDIMTHDELCKVLIKEKIHRILFFGDSLTGGMYHSLLNLIGKSNFRPGETQKPLGTSTIVCNVETTTNDTTENRTSGQPHLVHLRHERDKGGNGSPKSPRGEYIFDNDTYKFLNYSTDRVLGLFNIGAHYHNFTHYEEDMDTMLKLLSDLNRTQDLYMFRSTSPGHDGCEPKSRQFNWTHGTRITPLSSYNDYHIASPHRFDWDKFEQYNHYTRELLHKRNIAGEFPVMHFLDIFNMTVLRHDAHAAPADCLHFVAPGPVDWWNHLLFTYLQNLSIENGMLDCTN